MTLPVRGFLKFIEHSFTFINPNLKQTWDYQCISVWFFILYPSTICPGLFSNLKKGDSATPRCHDDLHNRSYCEVFTGVWIWSQILIEGECWYSGSAKGMFVAPNIHGDITHTTWGWFQLLCMFKTNRYICFYFGFCLWIKNRGEKNCGFS